MIDRDAQLLEIRRNIITDLVGTLGEDEVRKRAKDPLYVAHIDELARKQLLTGSVRDLSMDRLARKTKIKHKNKRLSAQGA